MDEKYAAYASADVTVSLTYGDDTVDIYTDVKELLLQHQKIGEGLASTLMDLIDESIESIEDVKNHKSSKRQKSEPEDSEPTVTPKEKIIEVIDDVTAVLQQWLPGIEFKKRRLGRQLYMKLLQLIKQQIQSGNKSFVLEDIVDHLQEIWKPIISRECSMSEAESDFMTEVNFLVKECRSIRKLKPSVEGLLREFKQQLQSMQKNEH